MGVLRFPAFLPGDDSPGRAGAGAGAGALVEALGALLRLPSQGFWDEAVHSRELRDALDSFLRFRRRAADGPGRRGGDRAADPATEALVRRGVAAGPGPRRRCAGPRHLRPIRTCEPRPLPTA